MLDERPSAAELIAAVAEFLDSDVVGALDGRAGFHARVAVNALRIVERELSGGAAVAETEVRRLGELTGSDSQELQSLNTELAAMIRDGEFAVADQRLRRHLIDSALARIAIDSPRYPARSDAVARWPEFRR